MITMHIAVNAMQVVTVRAHRIVKDGDSLVGTHWYQYSAEKGGEVFASGKIKHSYQDNLGVMMMRILKKIDYSLQLQWTSIRQPKGGA